uniref:Delta-like protein n=1 Tax=Heterorhabditis bacteriophora TaxID=37862 RepID=A0A1I7X0D9_HETBA
MRPAIQQPVIRLYQTVFLLLAIVFVSGRQHCTEDAECHNKGKCNLTIGDCYACAPGWTGYMCEVEITACTSQPCVNGACTPDASKQNGYQCLCDTRFMGENCEEDKNECKYGVCPTESLCVNLVAKKPEDLGYSCICSEGLTGTKCETEVNLCKLYQDKNDNYCKNGGICEASKNCMCPDGFGGSRCDQRVPFYSEYDELGCKENAETCAKLFDNGQCDPICNSELCLFDGFDCAKTNVADVCSRIKLTVMWFRSVKGKYKNFQKYLYLDSKNSVIVINFNQVLLPIIHCDFGNYCIFVDPSHLTSNGTMMFFDVDTAGCRQRKRRDSTLRCFTDLRVAAKFLTVELARENVNVAGILPIRDITWQKKELASWRHLAHSRLLLALFSTAIVVLFFVGCLTVLSIIIRTRKRKQKSEFDYHPPTPPYHGLDSPCSTPPREDHNENVVNSKKIRLCEDVYSASVKGLCYFS